MPSPNIDAILAGFLQGYGLKDQGYVRAGFDDNRAELEILAKALWGPALKTDENTGIGKYLTLLAVDAAKNSSESEKTWFSGFPQTASGNALDHLAPMAGVIRYPATFARHVVFAKGQPSSFEPTGFRVATADDIIFWAIEPVQFDAAGDALFTVEAEVPGRTGNVDPHDIIRIVNPTINVDSVQGQTTEQVGYGRESDFSFRQRIIWAMKGIGTATVPAIKAQLLRVEGVISALVIENDSDFYDSDGRPPHSFEAYVLGGQDQDIAQRICDKKAAGIQTWGNITRTVNDANGRPRQISFSRITSKQIFIRITLWKDATYSDAAPDRIRDNLVHKIGGVDSTGERFAGYDIGADVHITDLYESVYEETGVKNVTMEISDDGINYADADIIVSAFEVAETTPAVIQITEYVYVDR